MKLHQFFYDKSKWTKHTLARNSDGFPCDVDDDDTKSFCLVGAISKMELARVITKEEGYIARDALYRKLEKDFELQDITTWNDAPTTSFDDIISVLKELDI